VGSPRSHVSTDDSDPTADSISARFLSSWAQPQEDNVQSGLSPMKKTIPIEGIRADLKNDTSDEELIKKYGLSEKGLRRLLEEFLKAVSRGSRQIEVESDRR